MEAPENGKTMGHDSPKSICQAPRFRNANSDFRILYLYYDLMNLYGDWANASVLARELNSRGYPASVLKKSAGDEIDFGEIDFIYIGSGTERSQNACMSYMAKYKDAMLARIEAGIPVLATGNSHELFGRAVTGPDGKRYEALGLLDFETVQGKTRVTGDCVVKATFLQDKLIGFINRAGEGQEGAIERPFRNELGPGANATAKDEGIRYKNLLGTYLTGPILVRNPPLLRYFADLLIGASSSTDPGSRIADARGGDPFFEYQEAAYRMSLAELSARIG